MAEPTIASTAADDAASAPSTQRKGRAASSPDFVRLAQLAHDSFVNRQRYEWRVNFSLWAGLAAVVVYSRKSGIPVLTTSNERVTAVIVVLVAYLVYVGMILRGHRHDKSWKHYYLARAEGYDLDAKLPDGRTLARPAACGYGKWAMLGWLIPFAVFTTSLVLLTARLLASAQPPAAPASQPSTPKVGEDGR